jgi:hypothetical protein
MSNPNGAIKLSCRNLRELSAIQHLPEWTAWVNRISSLLITSDRWDSSAPKVPASSRSMR